jgi:LysW-gamma-L-lysine carboxypeptidase
MINVNDTQAQALLEGLVSRYSPSTRERPAVVYLVEQMRALGFQAHIDGAGNAVGTTGTGSRTLLLLGHIDTVPGFIPVRQEDDRLYGRGTVDAKGSLATFVVAAARAAAHKHLDTSPRIMIVGAVEEEAATSKGARHLLRHVPAPDAVIIGEPSGWDRVTVGYKGRLLMHYTLTRENRHSAGPEDSVCEAACAFWQAVTAHAAAYNAERPRMFEQLSPSLRHMHSERGPFTQKATLTVGFRLPPKINLDNLETTMQALAGDAVLRFESREVAFHGSKRTPLARAFIQALTEEGVRPLFKVKSGTSDMNVVGPTWNCPILAYGPGDSSLDHTPNEHIHISAYLQAIEVLTRVLTRV